jgi:hypothetical protein
MTADCSAVAAAILALVTSGIVASGIVASGTPAAAQARCMFLECAPDDSILPAPNREVPLGVLRRVEPELPRPTSPSERCQRVGGGHVYCASSVLAPQYGFTYVPAHLTDGRLDTAWVEGDRGDGLGTWIVAMPSATVRGFEIWNGYHKNRSLFVKNSRVHRVDLAMSNGRRVEFDLDDIPGPQRFAFDPPVSVAWIQFTIRSVYRGTRYADTALTELTLLTD